jgi:branched-chain amino acid transport system ATP-binding protein
VGPSPPATTTLRAPGRMSSGRKANLARFLLRIKHELGTTMLWIEHDIELVGDLAEHVVVLDFGQKIAEGRAESVLRDQKVAEAYLGRGYDTREGSRR